MMERKRQVCGLDKAKDESGSRGWPVLRYNGARTRVSDSGFTELHPVRRIED